MAAVIFGLDVTGLRVLCGNGQQRTEAGLLTRMLRDLGNAGYCNCNYYIQCKLLDFGTLATESIPNSHQFPQYPAFQGLRPKSGGLI